MDLVNYKEKYEPKIKEFVCHNSHLRIVNFIIYLCYISAKRNGRSDWAEVASKLLRENYGIDRRPDTYIKMLADIKKGIRNSTASSGFVDILEPKSRYEKDAVYARLEVYIHEYLQGGTHYVGLPANQLVAVAQQYNSVVACEKQVYMASFMRDLNRFIAQKSSVKVEHIDIFEYLSATNNKFNVYDLDLMEALTESRIEQIANMVKRTALDRAVIVLISVAGRHITKEEYYRIMPSKFIEELEKDGVWEVINKPFCGEYKDLWFPMAYCIAIIGRKNFNDSQLKLNI